MKKLFERVQVIDSHTAGEPTRVVIAGGPDLGNAELVTRRELFRREHDSFRASIINEPRGSDVLVGALLCEPSDPGCVAAAIFFNNVGYLGMCGHGMIGVVATLAYLRKLKCGEHGIDTPVGRVTAALGDDGRITIANVPSYRFAKNVRVPVDGYGEVAGDIAWGGNWFFLVEEHGQSIRAENVERLTSFTRAVRRALVQHRITGANGAEIDHIELFGPPTAAGADSKNFVLCPGGAYDRSPCGTGTSAKLACLVADGKLQPGQTWRQEGILGTVFESKAVKPSSVDPESTTSRGDPHPSPLPEGEGAIVIPYITGSSYITGEATLLIHPADPFRDGVSTGAQA
jgi:4-hydroxyproline epimerase